MKKPAKLGPRDYAIGVAVLAAVFVGWGAIEKVTGGGDPTGLRTVSVVGVDTDDVGRVTATIVDVDYVVRTKDADERCSVVFFDEAGRELFAPNETESERGRKDRTNPTFEGEREEATHNQRDQVKVAGVPRTAQLDC